MATASVTDEGATFSGSIASPGHGVHDEGVTCPLQTVIEVQPSMGVRLETDFDAFFEREDAAAQLQHWREARWNSQHRS